MHYVTPNGIVDLTKTLLGKWASYILLGDFQSDRLEGEFGVYRQSCCGNYYISFEQVRNALCLMHRIKLFDSLNITHVAEHSTDNCCIQPSNEDGLFCLADCMENASHLNQFE